MNYDLEAARLKKDWAENPRWKGIKRGYSAEDVVRLRGSVHIEHTLARRGAEKLWKLVNEEPFVNTLGAMTGNQALQQVKAGLKAIYLSGWQVAADANIAGEMYPDQSLYPVNSVPSLVKRLNNALLRADQIDWAEDRDGTHWLAPIVAEVLTSWPPTVGARSVATTNGATRTARRFPSSRLPGPRCWERSPTMSSRTTLRSANIPRCFRKRTSRASPTV